jgi:hypothetical protein
VSVAAAVTVSALPVIYLDQNQWIELARAHYGRRQDPARRVAAAALIDAARSDLVLLPLSFGHYLETGKRRDQSSQAKLGQLQYELSKDWRIAEYGVVIRHEIEVALDLVLPGRVTLTPFAFVGKGVSHAMDKPASIRVAPEVRHLVDPARVIAAEAAGQREFERTLLTGYSERLNARTPRWPDQTTHSVNFMRYLSQFRDNLTGIDRDTQERAIYATSLLDCLDNVNLVLRAQRIPAALFEALDIWGISRFLDAQPVRRADMHLRRQWISNPTLRPKPGDLNDWAFLSIACMYCDIVVTERHFADLLNRPGLEKRARVLTSLDELVKQPWFVPSATMAGSSGSLRSR